MLRRDIDPQIAASSGSYLVVGMHHYVQFSNKAGKPLTYQVKAGAYQVALPYGPVQLCDLFAPMLPDVNAHLPLPTGKKDPFKNAITAANGYGVNCDKKTGGTRPANWFDRDKNGTIDDADFYWPKTEIYDARVLWDEHHKRFWIAALMKNSNTQWPNADDEEKKDWPAAKSKDVAHARRALLAIAVSQTEDPRDGWYLYWTDGFPQQAQCPSVCHVNGTRAGGASDYLSMGVTSKYLVVDGASGFFQNVRPAHDALPQRMTLIPTGIPQANAKKLLLVYQNAQPLTNPDGTELRGPELQPAVQHDPDLHGHKILFATKWSPPSIATTPFGIGYSVLLWTLSLDGTPTLYQQAVPVRTYKSVSAAAPQKGKRARRSWATRLALSPGPAHGTTTSGCPSTVSTTPGSG